MRPDTKIHLHFGINFIFAPPVSFTAERFIEFQSALAKSSSQLVFDVSERDPNSGAVKLRRNGPSPLEVVVQSPAPPISQLLILSAQPHCLPGEFVDDAQGAIEAFRQVAGTPAQIIHRDCTVRHLYPVSEDHSFKYLWERRLGQQPESFSAFDRPILGGGIRLVLPPRQGEQDDATIELKFESYLQDTHMLFVDCSFAWNNPVPGTELNAGALVEAVEGYIDTHALPFIKYGAEDATGE